MGGGAAAAHEPVAARRAAARGAGIDGAARAVDLDRRNRRTFWCRRSSLQGLLALRFRHAVHHVSHGVEQREQELRVLATLIERIEREPFDSPLLTSHRRPIAHDRAIARRRNPPAGAARGDPQLGPQSDLRADRGAAAARHAAGLRRRALACAVWAGGARAGWRPWRRYEALSALGDLRRRTPRGSVSRDRDEGPAAITRRRARASAAAADGGRGQRCATGRATHRTCCSSAARTCRARARCCGRSASTPCSRRRARRSAPGS